MVKKRIPDWSLVRFDPGEIPKANNANEQLLPLTMIEANLLACNRVVRYCYVIRPWGEPDRVQKKQKGHVIVSIVLWEPIEECNPPPHIQGKAYSKSNSKSSSKSSSKASNEIQKEEIKKVKTVTKKVTPNIKKPSNRLKS